MAELTIFVVSIGLAGLIFLSAKALDKKQAKIALKNSETNDFEEEED